MNEYEQDKLLYFKVIADKIDCNFIYDFENRMIFQFKMYLFQTICNEDLSLRYGWYIRYPYCPYLNSVFEYICNNIDRFKQFDFVISEQFKNKIDKFNFIYNELISIPEFDNKFDLIELFVKIDYLKNREKKSCNEIVEYLKDHIWHTKEQILKLWSVEIEKINC